MATARLSSSSSSMYLFALHCNAFWTALKETTISWCVHREPCGLAWWSMQQTVSGCGGWLEEEESYLWTDNDTTNTENFQHHRLQCTRILTSDAHMWNLPSCLFFVVHSLFFSSDTIGWSKRERKRTERQGKERSAVSWWIVTIQLFFFLPGAVNGNRDVTSSASTANDLDRRLA